MWSWSSSSGVSWEFIRNVQFQVYSRAPESESQVHLGTLKPEKHICIHGGGPELKIVDRSLRSLQITTAGKSVEKREPSYTVGGNGNWCSHYGEQYGGSSKK